MPDRVKLTPRDEQGRFLPIFCDNPNCDGELQLDSFFGRAIWSCNGLTHETDTGPLIACNRSYPAARALLASSGKGD